MAAEARSRAQARTGTAVDMSSNVSEHVRECRAHAAACGRRARAADDATVRSFWRQEQARWLRRAQTCRQSAEAPHATDMLQQIPFSPDAEGGVQRLAAIFNGVCLLLGLEDGGDPQARVIARTLIEAALAGESEPDVLIRLAIKTVSH